MVDLREARGITQTELARWLKHRGLAFHQQTVQRIENGVRPLRLNEAYLIADALDSRLDRMVNRSASELEMRDAINYIRGEDGVDAASGLRYSIDKFTDEGMYLFQQIEGALERGKALSEAEIWGMAWLLKIEAAWRPTEEGVALAAEIVGLPPAESPSRFSETMDKIARWRDEFPDAARLALLPASKLVTMTFGPDDPGPYVPETPDLPDTFDEWISDDPEA